MSEQITIEPISDSQLSDVEGLESFSRTFQQNGQKFSAVTFTQIEDPKNVERFEVRATLGKEVKRLVGTVYDLCNFDTNVRFTVKNVVNTGNLKSEDDSRTSRWTLLQDDESKEYELDIYFEKERWNFFPTRFQTQGNDPKRIYAAVIIPIENCAHESLNAEEAILDNAEETAKEKPSDKTESVEPTTNTQSPKTTQQSARMKRTCEKATKSKSKTIDPVSIVVGYTNEVASRFTEAKIKSMLSSVEADLAKSLENSGVNSGLSTNQHVRFEIQKDLVKTGADFAGLSAVEGAVLLSHHRTRFEKMHLQRNGANLVFLLIDGLYQGYHYKEFAVTPIGELQTGVFQHELGHMVATMGGNISVSDHHGLVDTGGNGLCLWDTLMGTGINTRINCWSTNNLQTQIEPGITITTTGTGDYIADYFHLAAEKMLTLGK